MLGYSIIGQYEVCQVVSRRLFLGIASKAMRENFFGSCGWDDLDYESWITCIDKFLSESNRILKPRGSLVCFMAVIKVETVISLALSHGLYYKTTGIWHKTNPMPRNMNLHYINSTEPWIYFVSGAKTGTFNNDGKALHDFYETPVASKKERSYGTHPTQKPLALINSFIEVLSNPGDLVVDPFMGSGTVGVSAKSLNRRFLGIEIKEDYFSIAKKRIESIGETADT